jgi:Tol biopolymer transport system component
MMFSPVIRRRHGAALAALALVPALALAAPGETSRISVSSTGVQGATAVEGSAQSADGRYVAFVSAAALTGTPTGGKKQLYLRDRQLGTTVIASVNAAGQAANADVDGAEPFNVRFDISGDGRYVVFATAATNLGAGDTNTNLDVFRKDLQTGALVLVSVNSLGVQANASVLGDPSVSGDGSRVAFAGGVATNLFPGDRDNTQDVVVRDISAGTTTLVSQNGLGAQSNGTSERPSISADGNVVAFEAVLDTTNLFLPTVDANAANDIVIRDLAAATTVPADLTTAGALPAANGANMPDISGDGRYVVFQTAEALDPVNDAANLDVYRRDRIAGVTTLVSAKTGLSGAGNGASKVASISADGQRVGFESVATDLAGTDGNAAVSDAYVRTVATKATERVGTKTGGAQEVNDALQSVISPSGGRATFTYSDVGNHPLVAGDTNLVDDIFSKELGGPSDAAGPTITLSSPVDGAAVNAGQVAVTGLATDPSGIVSLTVNGAPVRPGTAGSFTASLALGGPGTSTPFSLVARDGAGNTTTLARSVLRTLAPVVTPPVAVIGRASQIRASRSGKFVTVRFTLSGDAIVGVRLLRRSVKAGRARLRPVGSAVIQPFTAGEQTVQLKAPRLRRGNYRVRVTVRTATGAISSIRVLIAKPIRRLPPVAP